MSEEKSWYHKFQDQKLDGGEEVENYGHSLYDPQFESSEEIEDKIAEHRMDLKNSEKREECYYAAFGGDENLRYNPSFVRQQVVLKLKIDALEEENIKENLKK